MWKTLLRTMVRWYRGTDTEPIEEAKQQRLGKSAKIQTAYEAVMVNDLKNIAKRDREVVAQYQNQKLFGGKKSPPNTQKGLAGNDDMIIADDIRITTIKPSGLASEILKAAVLAALAYYGLGPILFPKTPEKKEPEQKVKTEHIESDYTIRSKLIPPSGNNP